MRSNGSKQWLLWINTILTAGAAFIGGRLWDKIDKVNDAQIRNETEIKELSRRSVEISREHHDLFRRLDQLTKERVSNP